MNALIEALSQDREAALIAERAAEEYLFSCPAHAELAAERYLARCRAAFCAAHAELINALTEEGY